MKKRKQQKAPSIFAAKLLFQFRVMVEGSPGKKRICEERIVHVRTVTAREALQRIKRLGKQQNHSYKNTDGNKVFFEFIGVVDMVCLDSKYQPDEVWYEYKELLTPMERRAKLIPKEKDLAAIRSGY